MYLILIIRILIVIAVIPSSSASKICRDYVHENTNSSEQQRLCSNSGNLGNDELREAEVKCCKYDGGGQQIEEDNPYLLSLAKYIKYKDIDFLSEFYISGSAAQRALFFIAKDDIINSTDTAVVAGTNNSLRLGPRSTFLSQRYALAKFYFEMGGANRWRYCWRGKRIQEDGTIVTSEGRCNHRLFEGEEWLSPVHECRWAFVSCNRDQRVTSIAMVDNIIEVTSTMPYLPTVESLKIPDEISLLESLNHMDLRSNRIEGSIPTSIGDLALLRHINLNNNEITGTIPMQLYKVFGLEYLNLGNNHLNGSISTAVGTLFNLRALHLGHNTLTGMIPSELSLPTLLSAVNVAGNIFTGSIPYDLCDQRGKYDIYDLDILRADCSVCGTTESVLSDCCCTSCLDQSGNISQYATCPNVESVDNFCGNYFNTNDTVHWYAPKNQFIKYEVIYGSTEMDDIVVVDNFDGYYYTDDELINFDKLETSYPHPTAYIGCDDVELYGCASLGKFVGLDGVRANEACCVCQGFDESYEEGIVNSVNVTTGINESCEDYQIAYPWPQHNCEWFQQNDTRCISHGNNYVTLNDNRLVLAKDACCICGGGVNLDTCDDILDWSDSHYLTPYTCEDFKDNFYCGVGGEYRRFNLGSADACCVCGGGISNVSKILVQPSYETCYSDYQWRSITPIESGQTRNSTFVTCTDFLEADLEPDINMCLAYGNLIGGNEHNATKSCCECRYGYESNGGGYRGVLTGAFMRVGLTGEYYNLPYGYSVSAYGLPSGSIYEFLTIVAESHGLGLVLANHQAVDNIYYSYNECIDEMILGNLDICLGGYPNETLSNAYHRTDPLFEEQHILVVRKVIPSFKTDVMVPFKAFTFNTWILVLCVLLSLGAVIDIIHNGFCTTRVKVWLNRVGSIMFNTINNFAAGSMTNASDTPGIAEKWIGTGLAIFLFFVLVAYGASNTASFVTGGISAQFSSLHDVSRSPGRVVCTRNGTKPLLIRQGFESSLFDDSLRKDVDNLYLLLQDNGTCDAVLLPQQSLTASSAYNPKLCDLYPLLDVTILTTTVVLPIPVDLGDLGTSFISRFRRMLDSGWFVKINEEWKNDYLIDSTVECNYALPNNSLGVTPISFFFPSVFAGLTMIISISFIFCSRSPPKNKNKPMLYDDTAPDELFRLISQSNSITKEELDQALSTLPDRSLLEALAKRLDAKDHELSHILDLMTIMELIQVLDECVTDYGITKDDIGGAIRSSSPKSVLEDLILQHPEARIRVMDHALSNQSHYKKSFTQTELDSSNNHDV